MRYRILLCTIGLIVFLFSACAQQQSQMGYVGAESAKRVALEAALLSEQDVSSISTDLSTRNGLDYYQVSFESGGQSYRYDVDALTGVIINIENSPGADSGPIEGNSPQETERADSVPDSAHPSFGAASSAASGSGSDAYIGEEKARRIALDHAGLEENQVTFVCSPLEFDDGQWAYDVEFYTANYEEYDYEIDAYTGAVISFDYDAEYYSPQTGSSSTITAEQAQQLALAQVPGATQSDMWEFEIDDDDGILLYEGKIIYNNMEYEFEIDAYSGFIREWSAEPFAR